MTTQPTKCCEKCAYHSHPIKKDGYNFCSNSSCSCHSKQEKPQEGDWDKLKEEFLMIAIPKTGRENLLYDTLSKHADWWLLKMRQTIQAEREKAYKEGWDSGMEEAQSRCLEHSKQAIEAERSRIVGIVESLKRTEWPPQDMIGVDYKALYASDAAHNGALDSLITRIKE